MKISPLFQQTNPRAPGVKNGSAAKKKERAQMRREWIDAREAVRDHDVSMKLMFPGEIFVCSVLVAMIGLILIWGAAHASAGGLAWPATASACALLATGLALALIAPWALMAYGAKRARLRIAMVKARTPDWEETNTRLVARERASFESLELRKAVAGVKAAPKSAGADGARKTHGSKYGPGAPNPNDSPLRQTQTRRL